MSITVRTLLRYPCLEALPLSPSECRRYVRRFLSTRFEGVSGIPFPIIHRHSVHSILQAAALAKRPYDPTRFLTTTPQSGQGFALVSQADQRIPSRERVSRCCPKLERRGFDVACRVPGWRESSNHPSSLSTLSTCLGYRRDARSCRSRIPGIHT